MSGFELEYGLLRGRGLDLGPYVTRYPFAERSMVRLLAQWAADSPAKDWVVFDSTVRLTYGEAWRSACRVGHALDRDGSRKAHVAIFMRNQREFLEAFYGAIVRGGVAVPLNAEARGPLLQATIAHSDAEVLVVGRELVARLDELEGLGAVTLVVVTGDEPAPAQVCGVEAVVWDDWLAGAGDSHAWPFPESHERCMIAYTSGTTARPKGVVYSHNYLWMYAGECADSQERTSDDVLTAPLPLCHVAALEVIVNSALHAGATAHVKSKFSASRYWQQAAEDGATWAVLLGPMATMILKATEGTVPEHRLTRMFCPPPPPEKDEFERRFAPVKIIWWGYGMTEVYAMPMTKPEDQDLSKPLDTIGMPPKWIDYGVVDEHDRLLGPNELGELVFRPKLPHCMFSEYYKAPELTAEACRNLMFHTGDIAYYDEDGDLHYKGRKQERLRVKGENVSAAELEWVALQHEAVVHAAAYGMPSELGEDEIKLDLMLKAPVPERELHAWLVDKLPKYMVPRYLEIRDEFPRTPSERVEKYKLQAEPLDRPSVFDARA